MQKGLKAFVLIIIFGVPVFWYLFLQLFGTNEFELPTMGRLDATCVPAELAIYLVATPNTTEGRNQLKRIEQNHLTKDLLIEGSDCSFEDWELILVSPKGEVKGAYLWDIAEMDRLITEVELYHTIVERDGSGSSE